MFEKLMFWKKNDEFNLDLPNDIGLPSTQPTSTFNTTTSNTGENQDPFAFPSDISNSPINHQTMNSFDTHSMEQPKSQSSFSFQQNPYSSNQAPQKSNETHESVHPRDIELILAKLDNIKVSLDHLSTRVGHLEDSSNKKSW